MKSHARFAAKRILVATDFSSLAERALPMALAVLAKGGKLRLLYVEQPVMTANVVGPEMAVPVYDPSASKKAAQLALKHAQRLAKGLKGVRAEARVIESSQPARAIAKEAKRFKADLVCLSTHGRSALKRLVFGSVAMKLLSIYQGPVLLLKPGFGRKR